jgi:hypothetical protein
MPANNIPVWNIITNETLPRFINQSPFIITSDRGFDKYFKETGYQVGETINIRQRRRSFPVQGRVANPNAIQNPLIPLTISQEWNDSIEYTGKEVALFLEKEAIEFAEREIAPMATGLANNIELFCAQQATLQINNIIGDPSQNLSSYSAIDDAKRFLLQLGVNLRKGCYIATSLIDAHTLRSALNNQFNPVINEEIDIHGSLGNLAGFDLYESALIDIHTNGPLGGTPIVSATTNSGDGVISISGFTPSTLVLNAGDVIYFAGVFSINPLTYNSTGNLMQFVVTSPVTSDISGNAVIPIFPSIISDPSNTTRNVTGAIPFSTPLQLYGAPNAVYNVNIAYAPEALILAVPPKPPLYIVNYGQATDEETGVSLRLGMAGDIFNDVNLVRLDALYGALWNAQYCVKIASLAT